METINWFLKFIKFSAVGTIKCFHVTIAADKILSEGFKTRSQLSGKASLGGGPDDAISFTTDWHVAKGIYDAFVMVWEIVNSPSPIRWIKNHFYNLKDQTQKKVDDYFKTVSGRDINMFFDGYVIDGMFMFSEHKHKPMTKEQLDSFGYKPVIRDGEEAGTDGNLYYQWQRPINPKETKDMLYSYIKAYLAADEDVYDPLFFGTNIDVFKGIKKENIGIITAAVEINTKNRSTDDFSNNKTYRYVDSMAELRVYDTSIIKQIISFDNVSEKTDDEQGFVASDDENLNIALNKFMSYVRKNYNFLLQFLKSGGIAIDQLISMIQSNGHKPYKLNELFSYLKKQLNFANTKYLFENYNKYNNIIKVPDNIKKILSFMPNTYSNRILNGDKFDDVDSDLYEQDKDAYNVWYENVPYDQQRELKSWSDDRKYNLSKYNAYGKREEETLKQLFGDFDLTKVTEFGIVVDEFMQELYKADFRF